MRTPSSWCGPPAPPARPRRTVLTVDALAASSMATAFALKGEGQWLLALPVQYVAGVQVLVRSLFAGTRPWAMDMSSGFTPEAFTAAALELTDKIRFTSLVPTQLQRLLDAPSADTLAVLRRFNAHPARRRPGLPGLLAAARDAGVRVITTYGSAETCGGCVYDGFPARGRAGPGGGRRPDPARRRHPRRRLPRRPRAHRRGLLRGDGVRWYRTSDLGCIDAAGKLTVLGRADDVVITGGVKVSAAHVQAELEKLDGVRAALCRRGPLGRVGPGPRRLRGAGRRLRRRPPALHRRRGPRHRRWARWPRKPCWPPVTC